MRPRAILGLGALICLVPATAGAQNLQLIPTDYYYGYGTDTAVTIPVGGTRSVYLRGSVSGGVSAYSVTVFFDTTRLRLVRTDSVVGFGLPAPTITPLANGATLTAAGPGTSYGVDLAILTWEMKATATSGSLMSMRVNQWTDFAGAAVAPWTLTTDVRNACLAHLLWGDPDSSLSVTGRDALIALTYAVQLPVSGFNLAVANVDDDQAVTSRDALLMLSYAVAASGYYYYARTGLPFAGACAPLAGVPGDMVFKRAGTPGLYRVPAGDSVAIPIPTVTPFSDIGSTFVRWAPDGTRVLATASTADYWAEPIAVTLATLAEDTLARNPAWDGGGSYSPDGTRIAFFSDRASPYLWVMDANGANPIQLQTSTTVSSYDVMNPAWSPNGQRVAFVGYQTCCTQGLWSVLVADGTVRLEFPISGSYPPLRPSWSPAGDSLLFHANNRVYAVAAPDTATAPRPVVSLSGTLDYASWTPAGIVFRRQQGTSAPTTYDYYLRQPDGRIVRVYRPPGTEDIGASFR